MTATTTTHAKECTYKSSVCNSGCPCACHQGRKAGEHYATRTPHPVRFPGLPRTVTYSCNGCDFTITDTGDEAKLQWLRHELRADEAKSEMQRHPVGGGEE